MSAAVLIRGNQNDVFPRNPPVLSARKNEHCLVPPIFSFQVVINRRPVAERSFHRGDRAVCCHSDAGKKHAAMADESTLRNRRTGRGQKNVFGSELHQQRSRASRVVKQNPYADGHSNGLVHFTSIEGSS